MGMVVNEFGFRLPQGLAASCSCALRPGTTLSTIYTDQEKKFLPNDIMNDWIRAKNFFSFAGCEIDELT